MSTMVGGGLQEGEKGHQGVQSYQRWYSLHEAIEGSGYLVDLKRLLEGHYELRVRN